MEQRSSYYEIEVQNPSKFIDIISAIIPALPTIPLSEVDLIGRIDGILLQLNLFPKNCYIPFTVLLFHLFLFLKIVKRNAVLVYPASPFQIQWMITVKIVDREQFDFHVISTMTLCTFNFKTDISNFAICDCICFK